MTTGYAARASDRPGSTRPRPSERGINSGMDQDDYPTIRGAMTTADVAKFAGVSETTIGQYHRHNKADLPEPKAVLAGRPIWEFKTIAKWVETRRTVGRPAKNK